MKNLIMKPKPGIRRRSVLDIQTKIKLLADFDSQISRKELVKKYGIGHSTLCQIIQNRVKTQEDYQVFMPGRKRTRLSNVQEVDKELFAWYKESLAQNIKVTAESLAEKAYQIAAHLGNKELKISTVWIHRFKNRHGIKLKYLPGHNRAQLSASGRQQLDKELLAWYEESLAQNTKVTAEMLAEQAYKIGVQLGKKDFKASKTWLHRFKIRHDIKLEYLPGHKRVQRKDYPDIDKELLDWYKELLAQNTKVTKVMIAERACQIAAHLGNKEFEISTAWIHRFKTRYGIKINYLTKSMKREMVNEENLSLPSSVQNNHDDNGYMDDLSDEENVKDEPSSDTEEQTYDHKINGFEDFSRDDDMDTSRTDNLVDSDDGLDEESTSSQLLRSELESAVSCLLQQYSSEDVFIAEETGLFYKCLPHEATPNERHKCSRGQKAKERFTLLVSTNMTGTEKLPLLVVGSSSSPCAKDIKSLPVQYRMNKHSWMTAEIFEQWLHRLNAYFEDQGRSILLIVKSSPVLQGSNNLNSVKIMSIESCTSYLPPCAMGIFNALKCLYRTKLIRQYLAYIQQNRIGKKYHVSVLDSLFILRTAWDQVEQNIISKAFRMAGFVDPCGLSSSNFSCASDLERYGSLLNFELKQLLERLNEVKPVKCTAPSYVCMDEHIKTSAQAVISKDLQPVSSSDESDSKDVKETDQNLITMTQVMTSLQILQQFSLQHERGDELFTSLGTLFEKVGEFTVDTHKEPTITTLFKKENT